MNTQDLFSLQGRTAIVTGGSRGIGRMIVEGFVRQGARVYITARKAEACEQTAKELSALGHCVALPLDVSSLDGAKALLAAYAQHESQLDILVNNAGAAWGAPFNEFPEAGWDKVVDLNMKAPFFLTQTFAPMLRAAAKTHAAKVINIRSTLGKPIRTPPAKRA
jgi:NAD(P)-dependent dehydrogenase (short-subunit alcohol dehydrogenase family)